VSQPKPSALKVRTLHFDQMDQGCPMTSRYCIGCARRDIPPHSPNTPCKT
jgi:hypothetical protein